jgi:hypothetical protein
MSAGKTPAMAVAAGSLALADEVFWKVSEELVETQPGGTRELAEMSVSAYQRMLRESINNQVLQTVGLTIEDLVHDSELSISDSLQKELLASAFDTKKNLRQQLTILLGGVDEDGGHLYQVTDDIVRNDRTGFMTVGSGSRSAQLTFTRGGYDKDCSLQEALLTVVEAKARAEEAQGVGPRMDIAVVGRDGTEKLTEDQVRMYEELLQHIEYAEQEARENAINDEDSIFEYNT